MGTATCQAILEVDTQRREEVIQALLHLVQLGVIQGRHHLKGDIQVQLLVRQEAIQVRHHLKEAIQVRHHLKEATQVRHPLKEATQVRHHLKEATQDTVLHNSPL